MAWNRSNNEDAESFPRQTKRKFSSLKQNKVLVAIVIALIIVIGGVALWLFLPTKDKKQAIAVDQNKQRKIREATPTSAPASKVEKTSPPSSVTTNSPKWEAAVGLDPSLFPYNDGRKVISTRTNDWDQIIDICIMPNGRSRKVIRKATPQVFEHATDQLIALALSGRNDVESTPLPLDDDMEPAFLKSLETPIVVKDDDSDAVRRMKQDVIEARKVIQEELRTGRSFKSILEDHLAQRKNNAAMRADAMAAVRELKDSGDTEMVNEYMTKVNELLRSNGISEIGESRKKKRAQSR